MNPTELTFQSQLTPELRMMWMSQYNPERIALEDATSYFSHPSDMIVGGDFSGQSSAAAAAALGVPTTLIAATNTNDIYGITQVGGIHQVLQQSAAFQNYPEIIDDDDVEQDGTQYVTQVYDQMDDSNCYDGGISGLTTKQEIINIDDFVMMTDSNSYDGTELIPGNAVCDEVLGDENPLLVSHSKSSSNRAQRKTRKIEPVNRPGLVLKTPIAYKGNIDPSVIPIQKDGMAVCERCGAIGVKHTFYTKSRRFCSMSCARGELFSLVCNKMIDSSGGDKQHSTLALSSLSATTAASNSNLIPPVGTLPRGQSSAVVTNFRSNNNTCSNGSSNGHQPDIELALRVSHIKNSNYRFKITDQSLTQISSNESLMDSSDLISDVVGVGNNDNSAPYQQHQTKSIEMYRDVLPQDELPQIPKFERLSSPCPQSDKICSVRRRQCDPTHSYDWTPRLDNENFYAASVTCFPHAPGYDVWDNIGIDMKVEVENTDCESQEIIQPGQTPHSFWVATILNICGYKALMRYEGFDESTHDFWVNLCSSEVHSVGWCATRGKPLIPPRSIENKFKDWKDFLVERLSGARTLPSSFYNKISDSMNSRFRIGLNLECVDKDRISQVRLATVHKIVGKRLFVKYFDSDDGFWCHEDSPIIHPVGWATTVGHNLAAPQDYLERMLAGREQMIEVHEDDATIELFKMNFTFEEYYLDGKTNGFMEGMKIEAVDPLNLSSICAATVMAVLKFGYMMIRIDSYQPDASGSDWFCYHEKSPSIFPVGFCETHHIVLTPPNGYDTNSFTWEKYLTDTRSIAAGEELFHRLVPEHGFEVGMSLECADLMDPRLVCVATVARVVGRLLKVHFDGWTDEYDQWLDCESPDFYPVGWCVLVNHKLEGPPIHAQQNLKPATKPKQKKRKKKIVTGGKAISRSINIKKEAHNQLHDVGNLSKTCGNQRLNIKKEMKSEPMYYEEDDDDEEEYEDDVSRSDQSTPLSHTPETSERHRTVGLNSLSASNATLKANSPAPPIERKATSYIGNSLVTNSKYIPRLSESVTPDTQPGGSSAVEHADLMPETWNVYDVSQFLRVNDCTAHCDMFSRNKIDGKRLLQLSKDEVITLLGMKVGPALKIYDLIQQLKCKTNPSKSRLHKANKSFL